MSISKIEWDIIDIRVKTVVKNHSLTTQSIGFLWLSLEQLFPSLQNELLETITDGPDDRGIDAIHLIESDDSAEIFLFQAKYRNSVKTTNKTINDSEVLKISLFLDELFNKSHDLLKCNFRLREIVQRIWGIHKAGKICRYSIVFCSNDSGLSETAEGIVKNYCSLHRQVTYQTYGPSDLIRDISINGRAKSNGTLQVISKEVFERADGDVRGAVASVDANSFIDLICDDDGAIIKRHVFDDNLRIFLGSKGGYNTSIIETATSDDSYLFWYLNNGITITCRGFSYNKGHSNPTLRLDDFQIVNGAQTSHSLLEAKRLNPDALENVVVMVRIYATARSDIAEKVAVATNSQARIQNRDLRANSAILKKLELVFLEKQYYFERKRNMHSDKPEAKRLDALKLGQVIASYYLREPDRAKTNSDDIFDSQFQAIFHERHEIAELCRVWELHRIIEQKREYYISKYGQSAESDHMHRYLVYGQWFVLFVCGLLLTRSETLEVPTGPEADQLVEDSIKLIASACSQNKAVAHYQMFRSSRTKEKVFSELDGKQADLFD